MLDRVRRNRAIRIAAYAAIFAPLAACDERVQATCASYADAERSGLVERGWIPQFVPKTAVDITDSHDLDTGAQILKFYAPEPDLRPMGKLGVNVTLADAEAAKKLISTHGLRSGSLVRIVCAEPRNGVLLIDIPSDRAVYDTQIRWADDDCG